MALLDQGEIVPTREVTNKDVASAAATLGPILSEGDLVLVKASRAAGLDGFVKEVLAQ